MTTARVTAEMVPLRDLSRAAVLRLSEALADPGWLRERKLAAWEAYERLPVPSIRSEAWRYTDLSRLAWEETQLAFPTDSAGVALRSGADGRPGTAVHRDGGRPATLSGRVELSDGVARASRLDPELAAQGVVFTDLITAIREHPELVEPHLLRSLLSADVGKLAALHAALTAGGAFLYVPAGVQVGLPLEIVRTLSLPGAASFPHTLVVTGAESSVVLVERSTSPTQEALAMSAGALEILAGPASTVRIVTLQEWGRHVFHYASQRAALGRDARVHSLVVTLGGRLSRVEVQSVLAEEGATSEMLGLYFGDGDQHVDHHTLQLHHAPHTNSDLLYKGALQDRARSAFSGLIKVARGAQRTDAYQKNRNLLLSPEARADSLPNLEIEADDVRCTHGATVGPADELQLFYLMSRGLRREQAERLLVYGFFEEVLAHLPLVELREEIRSAVERRAAPGVNAASAAESGRSGALASSAGPPAARAKRAPTAGPAPAGVA